MPPFLVKTNTLNLLKMTGKEKTYSPKNGGEQWELTMVKSVQKITLNKSKIEKQNSFWGKEVYMELPFSKHQF